MSELRLNLGCGMKRIDGYLNVDRFGEPDLRHDLEVVPWPWPDDSVNEILLISPGASRRRSDRLPRDHEGIVPRLSGWRDSFGSSYLTTGMISSSMIPPTSVP